MSEKEYILIADDKAEVRAVFRDLLEKEGYGILEAEDGMQALEAVNREMPSLAFIDFKMPKIDGLAVLEKIKQQGSDIPVIIISAYGTMDSAIRAIRLGAYDFLPKPIDLDRISKIVERCLEERRGKARLDSLQETLPDLVGRFEMVGNNPEMLEVYKTIGAIAGTPNTTTVLILGESGTGKELVARQIHLWGERPEAPFIALNMASFPERLLESELFGFERGAFTGAAQLRRGKFEVAERGTIFLDEISGLSFNLQHKMLRVLQEREFDRLGSEKTLKVKARIIAASNSDLEEMAASGHFREDLLYRLNMVTIKLPPLRDRRDDIPLMAQHFAQKYANRMNRKVPEIPPETITHLSSYDWPGNVRSMEHAIAQAMVKTRSGRLLPEDIPLETVYLDEIDPPVPHHDLKRARQMLNDAFEKKFLRLRLAEARGNVSEAAETAGINRESFHRLMKKHNINAGDFR